MRVLAKMQCEKYEPENKHELHKRDELKRSQDEIRLEMEKIKEEFGSFGFGSHWK